MKQSITISLEDYKIHGVDESQSLNTGELLAIIEDLLKENQELREKVYEYEILNTLFDLESRLNAAKGFGYR